MTLSWEYDRMKLMKKPLTDKELKQKIKVKNALEQDTIYGYYSLGKNFKIATAGRRTTSNDF